MDVQLYAFDRPFLSALGYPQSWAHVNSWEGNWATHNSVWSVVDGVEPLELPFDTPWHFLKEIAGRGHLLRLLRTDGVQVVEVEAQRWVFDTEAMRWTQPGVTFRRLIALVETGGDGVALVDLARLRGGDEHWRLCRGLEGTFIGLMWGSNAFFGFASSLVAGQLAEAVSRKSVFYFASALFALGFLVSLVMPSTGGRARAQGGRATAMR